MKPVVVPVVVCVARQRPQSISTGRSQSQLLLLLLPLVLLFVTFAPVTAFSTTTTTPFTTAVKTRREERIHGNRRYFAQEWSRMGNGAAATAVAGTGSGVQPLFAQMPGSSAVSSEQHPDSPKTTKTSATTTTFDVVGKIPKYIQWTLSSSSSMEESEKTTQGSVWKMQTAVTSFTKTFGQETENNDDGPAPITVQVQLHAQLHFGSVDYFDYYNTQIDPHDDHGDPHTNKKGAVVLYELLVDEKLRDDLKRYQMFNSNNHNHHHPQVEKEEQVHADTDDSCAAFSSTAVSASDKTTVSTTTTAENTKNTKSKRKKKKLQYSSVQILAPSPSDQATAAAYGLTCQVNVVNYCQPGFIHADWTRQEFLQKLKSSSSSSSQQPSSSFATTTKTPLWQLSRQQQQHNNPKEEQWSPIVSAVSDAATALLVGPPILLQSSKLLSSSSSSTTTTSSTTRSFSEEQDVPYNKNYKVPQQQQLPQQQRTFRRLLFTNLFLSGHALAVALRACLWVTVPSPELSILLLDWSSLVLKRTSTSTPSSSTINSRRRNTNDGRVGMSPIVVPLLQALRHGRWDAIRKLVFSQAILQAQQEQQQQQQQQQQQANALADPTYSLLVQDRNDQCLSVLEETIQKLVQQKRQEEQPLALDKKKEPIQISILYGCSHCPDLHTKLIQRHGFKYDATKTFWRTAWSVEPTPRSDHDHHEEQQQQQQEHAYDRKTTLRTDTNENDSLVFFQAPISLVSLVLSLWPPLRSTLLSSSSLSLSNTTVAIRTAMVVLLPIYLLLGGLDWISTWQDVGLCLSSWLESANTSDAAAAAATVNDGTFSVLTNLLADTSLYLIRHVALYIGISKLVLDWNDQQQQQQPSDRFDHEMSLDLFRATGRQQQEKVENWEDL